MGVLGLTTYIKHNQDLYLKDYHLHNTNLVIDGHNLCAQLYFKVNNTFSAFGGDYDKFASCTKTFFKNLRKCNITPYVIFDGCHERRKLRTVLSRLSSKLNGVARLDPVTQDSNKIFPYMLRDVFREVLIEMEIAYTICEFEADNEIAALARHLNCPVLSYDSDFFIYNVLYIPFHMLEIKPIQIEDNGKTIYVMKCKLYKLQNLCEHSGLKEELLPLLATLLGNDFVEKKVFSEFFSQLKMPKSKRKNEQQQSIQALFNWLKNESLNSAITKILGRFKRENKNKVQTIIKNSINGYYSNDCNSIKYFNLQANHKVCKFDFKMPDEDANADDDLCDEEGFENFSDSSNSQKDEQNAQVISNYDLKSLPQWFADKIRNYLVPTSYLNLYAHHLHICNPQAEDHTDKDSFLCVLPIVRYAFDIMTDFHHENCLYYCRESSRYRKLLIGKEYSVERPLDTCYEQLTNVKLKQYFRHFLDIKLQNLDYALIEQLPSNFQLFMISILWWISYCCVPEAHVHSLFMSYIMLQVIDEKTGTARGHFQFNNRHASILQELRQNTSENIENNQLYLNKNKVQYKDCLLAASVLLKHFDVHVSILKRPKSYDVQKIHSFAEFQCVLQQINALNILCSSPYNSTVCYKSYNGTFVYNIALQLENQSHPATYLEQYIKGSTTVLFYKSICKVYNELVKKMNIQTRQWSRKRKRSRWVRPYTDHSETA